MRGILIALREGLWGTRCGGARIDSVFLHPQRRVKEDTPFHISGDNPLNLSSWCQFRRILGERRDLKSPVVTDEATDLTRIPLG